MSNLYIIIPVFNEAENIPTLANNLKELQSIRNNTTHFLFIDDGSIDNTCDEITRYFSKSNFEIIKHQKNLGPGQAFASGFRFLADKLLDEDWVLTMEGDNTSSHELVTKMFHRAEEGYDVILASPYMYGGTIINTTRLKKFLSFVSNLFLKELLGLQGIFTMSNFFRLHQGKIIRKMQTLYGPGIIESKGFEGIVEMLMKLTFMNATLSEIALVLDTSKRKGKSKMKILKTSFSLLMLFSHKNRWKTSLQLKANNKMTPLKLKGSAV